MIAISHGSSYIFIFSAVLFAPHFPEAVRPLDDKNASLEPLFGTDRAPEDQRGGDASGARYAANRPKLVLSSRPDKGLNMLLELMSTFNQSRANSTSRSKQITDFSVNTSSVLFKAKDTPDGGPSPTCVRDYKNLKDEVSEWVTNQTKDELKACIDTCEKTEIKSAVAEHTEEEIRKWVADAAKCQADCQQDSERKMMNMELERVMEACANLGWKRCSASVKMAEAGDFFDMCLPVSCKDDIDRMERYLLLEYCKVPNCDFHIDCPKPPGSGAIADGPGWISSALILCVTLLAQQLRSGPAA